MQGTAAGIYGAQLLAHALWFLRLPNAYRWYDAVSSLAVTEDWSP
jgi:hypothetical protein